jgi:GT2 family glycosyltransferase
MMSLSVIIVNYNVKYFLEQCLWSVRKAGQGLSLDIRVVDNASTDGSRSYLMARFPEVIFYWNDDNLGFARANNLALKDCRGDAVLFLNPDTILPEDCFRRCLAYLESHPEAGALGVRMLDGGGRFLRESKRGFPDPVTAMFKLTGMATLFPRSAVFARYHMGHLDPLRVQETDVLAGAFMMVRRKVLEQTGGFDEDYFMYGEDIDLSYRIRQAGWKNIYFPECPILHFKGESTRKGSLNYVRMFYGAMAVFARKHYGDWRANAFGFSIQLAILLRAMGSAAGSLLRRAAALLSAPFRLLRPREKGMLVVADESDFDRIDNLEDWKLTHGLPMVRHRLPDAGEDFNAWTRKLSDRLSREGRRELACCANGLSFRDIISLSEQMPRNTRLRIHAKGSDSLVGSGQALVLPPPASREGAFDDLTRLV